MIVYKDIHFIVFTEILSFFLCRKYVNTYICNQLTGNYVFSKAI